MSSELLPLVRRGGVVVKPDVERLEGDRVRFADGTEATADVLVEATGYRVRLPFFPDGFLERDGDELPLYLRTVHPDHPGLNLLGFFAVAGPAGPLLELQAQWVGAVDHRPVRSPSGGRDVGGGGCRTGCRQEAVRRLAPAPAPSGRRAVPAGALRAIRRPPDLTTSRPHRVGRRSGTSSPG